MDSIIQVKRYEYPATKRRPACFECHYYSGGREIAWYHSFNDRLYIKTDLIGHDFKKPAFTRALTSPYKREYEYLFNMLGVDETTVLNEYTSI